VLICGGRQAARPGSEPDGAFQSIGRHDLAPIIMAAMRADMMRALELTAIRALGVRVRHQRLMATPHASA
jgi:hypothetical protein